MSDFKVVLPTTTEEWQRDMNIAYDKGRADAIDEFVRAFIEEGKKIKYLRHLWIESTCKKVSEKLKEQQ